MLTSLLGYKDVRVASSGSEAVKMIDERRLKEEPDYSLVFMDGFMPPMDGCVVVRQVLRSYPDLQSRIVLLSGTLDLAPEYRFGCHGVLTKPLDAREIMSSIAFHCRTKDDTKVM